MKSPTVTAVIASFGSADWKQLAAKRARLTTLGQEGVIETLCIHLPKGTLAQARNRGAEQAKGQWLLFLDADDELAPDYCSHMVRAIRETPEVSRVPMLFAPSVQYVTGRRRQKPKMWPEKPLSDNNWLVIGTLIRRDLFWEIGGFDEQDPHGLEDWALFSRADAAGARVVKVPDAVYIAHTRRKSSHAEYFRKNRAEYMRQYHRIRRSIHPEFYDDAA